MKRLIIALLATGLIVAPLTPSVSAHDGIVHEDERTTLESSAMTTQETEAARTGNQQQFELRKERLRQAMEQRQKQLQDRQAKRCEFVKAKLQFHRDQAAEIRSHRSERYQRIIDRLDALADRLDVHDIDSAGLRDAIQRLTTIVGSYESTFTEYESELQEAIVKACDDDEFTRDEVKELRQLIVKLRSNAETVHTFIREELRPALAAVKAEVKAARKAAADDQKDQSQTEPDQEIDHAPPPPSETTPSDTSTSNE